MPRPHKEVERLLTNLQICLVELGMWKEITPCVNELNSEAPFACDVMDFENWLQFIFIPKLKYIIEQNGTLPHNMSLTPMAEIRFGNHPQFSKLLNAIQSIDQYFAG